MAPPPGFVAFCGAVAVATTAASGVKDLTKSAIEAYKNFTRIKCENCEDMVETEEFEAHLAKHREEEEEKKKEEEEKKKLEKERLEMEFTIKEMKRKIDELERHMQEKDQTMEERELKHQEQYDLLRTMMLLTCRECNNTVPLRDFNNHQNIHGKERAGRRQNEDEKTYMQEDHQKRGGNRSKFRK